MKNKRIHLLKSTKDAIKIIVITLFISLVFVVLLVGIADTQINRYKNRVVTLYNYEGNEIKSWSGEYAISYYSDNKIVLNDRDGNQIVVLGNNISCETY